MFLSRWQALEVLNEHRYLLHSDVWSFAVVMFEIWAMGEDPYEGDGW